jgi:hypothetical protein
VILGIDHAGSSKRRVMPVCITKTLVLQWNYDVPLD